MKTLTAAASAAAFAACALAASPGQAQQGAKMHPFILAANGPGQVARVADEVKAKLANGGFQVVGSYSPYPAVVVVAVTSDALKTAAAQTRFGAYGAVQRISVTQAKDQVQIAYTNPRYMAAAYRMKGDLGAVAAGLAKVLGAEKEFGAEKEAMTDAELRKYQYMFGMEYFDDPHELARHKSYADAVAAVEKNLAAGVSGVTKVYRVDVPGKEETVFGVAMNGKKGDGDMQDDTYLMSQIDFKGVKSSAHLPYEMVVAGDTVYALSARFRIAINFPDLSMMGSNSFMSIMGSPEAIKKALTLAAGGKPAS
ncbi:MAG: hypothetical protein FJX37_05720 [Alphaproteobacteria bacterium]|nr:hypothetical protein [Alphaproteobacteria bacterium]MBM3952835.1 hypothetical protein [Rhodospirillales bacterium]